MILDKKEWIEYRPDGSVWITGQIGIVADMWKHLYDYRVGFKGYEGQPVCRLGIWTKYDRAGHIAWTLDYGNGMHKN